MQGSFAIASRVTLVAAAIAAMTAVAAPMQQTPTSSPITPRWMPAGLGGSTVTVVVEMSGAPVALAQESAGRKLSRSEKDQIKASLKGNQNAVRGSVQALGGVVLADYQSAYNGIKVRIGRDKLDQVAALSGVVGVHVTTPKRPDNTNSIPFIGAPTVWQNLGLHGEGIKIAVIDTGIDYTHANFGGPGTAAAYSAAHALETKPANPALFGPSAPRVKGGIDLVGDSYNADPTDAHYQPIPHPDANPLDCNGHGSHVSGSAAGSGVTSDGHTFTGPYNGSTVSSHSWTIGPGVAPKADLYAVRVFGCAGSTDVVVDAIDWAVDNDMDVINMSLGSPFGSTGDPDEVASTNAAKAGVIVVAAAGNEGASPYIVGSPGAAEGAISVAANDATASFPGAKLTVNGITMDAIVANGIAPSGTYTLKVIGTGTNTQSLGCSVADFGGPLPPGTIAVVNRGTCARVAKAIFGQQACAAAVVMVNNATGLPPYEGSITSNPDDGVPYTVTIPFLGVAGPASVATSDGAVLRAQANGSSVSTASALIANPSFTRFASFSSAGPRTLDSALKPDITAPGVSVFSTANGTGNLGEFLSGTSMASPHVAGVAALTRQAHPTWNVQDLKAAIVNTGAPSLVGDYKTSRGGTGLVQPAGSTKSQVVARANDTKFGVSLNFGYQELRKDYSNRSSLKLHNNGSAAATFTVAQANAGGRPHTVSFDKTSVTVPGNGDAEVVVQLAVPAATAGNSNAFREVSGLVQLSPASASDNGGVTLRVPYYLVPRALSDVATDLGKLNGVNPSTAATITNKKGVITGGADFYAWGLFDKPQPGSQKDGSSNDVRAVGVQSFPISATDAFMVFAVNTYDRWSNASTSEFDIYVDVDGDGKDDYVIVGVDNGAITTGEFDGVFNTFVFDLVSGAASSIGAANTFAPTDASTALLGVTASQLCGTKPKTCVSPSNPRFSYHVVSFDLFGRGTSKAVAGVARFNAFSSAISQGGFATVAPGGSASVPVQVDTAEWAKTPALGVMVVTTDNAAGAAEAQLLDVKP